MRDYTFSNDGKRIAFGGSLSHQPVRSYTQPDLFVANAEPGAAPKNLTASYDFDIGGGIGGDQRAPRGGGGGGVIWSKDDRWLFVNVAEHGAANLKRIDAATGKVETLTTGAHEVQSYSVTRDASKMALLIASSTNIGDLFLLDTATGKLSQLTRINDELFSQLNLTDPEEIWYTSFDGKKIQAWIQKPPNFDPEEVSFHSRDPRRPARGVRLHVHTRVSVDGGKGYVVPTPTREAAPPTARTSATSFSTTIRATTIKT
jgi:dipeptidyl aminopeptidase/acylaminoacyl peptidase